MGSAIAVLGEEGDDISGAEDFAHQQASSTEKASSEPEQLKESKPEPKSEPEPSKPAPSESKSESKADLPKGDRIFASPIAKKIALERGIPLGQLKGTGPNGRIIREDVESYKASSSAPAPASTQSQSKSAPAPATPSDDYFDTPVSNMRRVIGSRLTQSKQEVPHYYLTVDVNMDKVLKLREVFNKGLAEKDTKLSVNDFVVKAVSRALVDVPEANSAWLGEVIRT